MKKIKTYEERRNEYFGITDGEELDLKNNIMDNIIDKLNEVVEWISIQENNDKQKEDLK